MRSKHKRLKSSADSRLPLQTAGKAGDSSPKEENVSPAADVDTAQEAVIGRPDRKTMLFAGGLLAIVFFWSYWPTLTYLVSRWDAVADYSHGFLVVPLALAFMWFRRDRYPHDARTLDGSQVPVRYTGAPRGRGDVSRAWRAAGLPVAVVAVLIVVIAVLVA